MRSLTLFLEYADGSDETRRYKDVAARHVDIAAAERARAVKAWFAYDDGRLVASWSRSGF